MKVYSAYQAGRLTVFLHGELDQHAARQGMEVIERLLDEYLPRECVLDFANLSFMDSSGIAMILKLHRRMAGEGGRAWVEHAAAQPLRVIDASGIERIMNVPLTREG